MPDDEGATLVAHFLGGDGTSWDGASCEREGAFCLVLLRSSHACHLRFVGVEQISSLPDSTSSSASPV